MIDGLHNLIEVKTIGGHMQIGYLPLSFYRLNRLANNIVDAGDVASKRLEIIKKWQGLKKSGAKDDAIATALGISRATFYRYQRAFKKDKLLGLKPQSTRPHKVRQLRTKRTLENISLARQIREANPTYSKFKIAEIMRRDEGVQISESTVGRILKKLMDKKLIKRATALKPKRRVFNGYAQKWNIKADRSEPGKMIQVDHMTVHLNPGTTYKQFQAWDPKTKTIIAAVYRNADSSTAAKFLEHLLTSLPFKAQSIQVDGGSEFMDKFEEACKAKDIPLFVLPPRSPKYNGGVERGNRIFREEFYNIKTNDVWNLTQLRIKLAEAVKIYNTYRPHRSLKGLTPFRYYQLIMEGKDPLSKAHKTNTVPKGFFEDQKVSYVMNPSAILILTLRLKSHNNF